MRYLAVLSLAAPLVLAGCLTGIDAPGTGNKTNGSSNNASSNNTPNAATNTLQGCDSCKVGDTRCTDSDGATVFQTCTSAQDGSTKCPQWTPTTTCTDAQMCDDSSGCSCPDDCSPGDGPQCTNDGLVTCMMVDGCPTSVNVCRPKGCDAAPTDVDCNAHPEWCQPCGGGRSCVQACKDDTDDCYTCGS